MSDTLQKLINYKDDGRSPQDPKNKSYFAKFPILLNEAWVEWYNGPGNFLIDTLEKDVQSKLINLFCGDIIGKHEKEIFRKVLEIKNDLALIDKVNSAYLEEEKRKEVA